MEEGKVSETVVLCGDETVDRFSLDLLLTVTEGSIHNLGTLICMAWVSASTYNPLHQNAGKAAILTRPNGGYGNLQAKELIVPTQQLAEVVDLMRQVGLPQRMPHVQAGSGNLSGWQEIRLEISLDGEQGRFSLGLQYGGITGEEAVLCSMMLNRLFGLLEVAYLRDWIEPC